MSAPVFPTILQLDSHTFDRSHLDGRHDRHGGNLRRRCLCGRRLLAVLVLIVARTESSTNIRNAAEASDCTLEKSAITSTDTS